MPRLRNAEIDQVARQVRDRLRSEDKVVVRTVEDILPVPSGKYRPVVSKVAREKLKEAAAGNAIVEESSHA